MVQTAQKHGRVGPYSRRLHRGAIGASLDGRSELGRFVRHLEAELVAHCGGAASITITQRLLIDRIIRTRLQLDALDEKLAAGSFTPHDQRTYGALLNAHRLGLRELGKPAAAKVPTLAEHLANLEAAQAAPVPPAPAPPRIRRREPTAENL